jgi:cob(I)alamin adenosyltransferase
MSDQEPLRMQPYGRHVLICTGGYCTAPEAALEIDRRLAELSRGHGRRAMSNPERIKCTPTGCLGVCQGGPILVVYPEGIWYHHVDEEALTEIVERHLLGGDPVESRAFHHLYPAGQEPPYPPRVRGDEGQWRETPAPTLSTAPPQGSPPPTLADEQVQAAEDYRHAVQQAGRKKGLVLVNTGDGKGKTTAAVGLLLRAWGRDLRVGVIQFLKNEKSSYGETKAAKRLGLDWIATGDGWTWTSKDMDETEARARHGWEIAREKIAGGGYDVLVLDEFTYPLHYGWLDVEEVVAWLAAHKPPQMHLVITGRHAPPALVEFADLVTEMREIKHPFRDQGIRAQPGVEY